MLPQRQGHLATLSGSKERMRIGSPESLEARARGGNPKARIVAWLGRWSADQSPEALNAAIARARPSVGSTSISGIPRCRRSSSPSRRIRVVPDSTSTSTRNPSSACNSTPPSRQDPKLEKLGRTTAPRSSQSLADSRCQHDDRYGHEGGEQRATTFCVSLATVVWKSRLSPGTLRCSLRLPRRHRSRVRKRE